MKNFKELSKVVSQITEKLEFAEYEFYCISMRRGKELSLQGEYSRDVIQTLQMFYRSKAEIDDSGCVGFKLKIDELEVTITLT